MYKSGRTLIHSEWYDIHVSNVCVGERKYTERICLTNITYTILCESIT